MQQNMGTVDRVLRAIGGILLLVLYFTSVITGTWGIVALIVAALLLITAAVGICPLYMLLRVNTRQS